MLMAYLPKEKLLFEADIVDTTTPLPTTLSNDQKNFYTAVQRLKLDVGQIVPVHGGPIAWRDFAGVASAR